MKQPQPSSLRLFTTGYVAAACQVSSVAVKKWIAQGKLRAIRTPGGHYRIAAGELDRFRAHYRFAGGFRPRARVQPRESGGAPQPPHAQGSRMTERTIRLLLIDDDRPRADVFRKELEASTGPVFDVRRLRSRTAARRFLGSADVDVAVLAVRGQADLDLLAALLESAAGVPVIALTAAKDERYGVEAIRRGAHDHILRDQGGAARVERCVRHARLYEETERRRRVAEELARTGRLLTATLDINEVAQRTADSVLRLFAAHSSIVRLLQPDGALRLLAAAGVSAEKLPTGHVAPAGEGIVGRAVLEGRSVWASDDLGAVRGALSASFADVLDRVGHRAVLAVPLRLEDRTIGVLALAHQQARAFSAEDIAVLEAFADQVVLAMENARLYAETERRRREAEALAEVGRVLSEGLDPDVVARRITDRVRELLHAQSAAIYGLDRSTGALVALHASTSVADTFQWTPALARGTGLGSRALHLRQPQTSADTAADPSIAYTPDVRADNERKSHRALLTVPLFVGERAFGVLAVGDVTGRVFTEDEIGLARRFGDQAVLALDNARLHAETERRGREAEVIAALAATLNASLDLDDTLQAVATAARELCGSDAARIALPDPGTDAMVFRYLDGDDRAAFEGVRIRAGDGAGGHVITTGLPFRTDDYFADTRITHPFDAVVRGQGVRAQVIVPIYGGRRLEGLLYAVNKRPLPFTDRAEAVLVRLADHAAIAIRNAQSFEREHAARAAAEALADLSRLVSETVDPAELAERITGSLRLLIEASTAALYRLDDDGDLRALGVSIEDRTTFMWPPTVAAGQGTMGVALRDRCTVTSADILSDPRLAFDSATRARLATSEFRAVLTVPLVAQDRILGVLAVGGRVGRVYEPEDIRLAEAFANQAALAIENARLFAETQERRREAELIADLARTINASLDLDTVLRRITEGARELCGTDAARISLRAPATGFVSRYAVGYCGPTSAAMRVEPGVGVGGRALVTGRACRVHDLADEAGSVAHHGEAVREEGIVVAMAAPLIIDGQVEGVLQVDGRSARRFSDGEEAGLQRLADHAAITLRNVRSFEREQAARTEAQRTAAALGESEEKMRVIVETALDAVVTMDAGGAITGWNAQAEAVFGWPRAQMLGRQLSDFLQIGEGPVVNRRVETLARHRDGVEIPVELAVATARMGGAVTFSAFIRDITERRRAEQREAVQFAVTRWLAESPTLSDAMPGLLRTIAEGLGWVCGQSWLIDRACDVMRWESAWCSAGPGLDALQAASRSTTFGRGAGIVGRVWQSGAPVWLEDISADPAFRLLDEARAADLKAMVALPIRSGSNMSGVMTFFTRESRSVDGELIEVLADIGGQIGQFAERRRAEDEAAARARQQSAVAELSRVALTGAELDEVMEQAVRLLARTLDAPMCRILELSADGNGLLLRAATGLREGLVNRYVVPTGGGTQSGYTLLCREPVIVDDVATESRFTTGPVFQEYGVASGMTVTIEGHERPFGVLGVHTVKQRRFTSDDAHFLQAMAGVIGAAFERRRAETIIRESERRYRLLADNISDVIWVRDLQLRLTYASPSAARLFGFTPDEMMGQGLHDLLTPESLQHAGESITGLTEQATHEAARSLTLELEARCKDGSTVWTETSVTILRGPDGEPASLLGVARDISARKRAEDALRRSEEQLRQAQKMEAIGRLAGGVAHDFNNIMTIIDGRSELMLAKLPADQPARRDVDIIRGAARRATGLTRQLLAFSRKQVLQPRVLDLNAVVTSMIDLLRRLIGEDVELVTVPGAGLHRVQADPGQLEQVMMNLAVNARDAMPAGGRLTIATSAVVLADPAPTDAPGAQAGPHVLLSVTDTGTGMDEATRARVFDPFFTTKGPGKGTGLGLSMVYGIVTQSGGRVAVTSAPGAGSTFNVWLPAVQAAAEVTAAPGADGVPGGTETILLVEDDDEVRDLAEEVLESLGYVVVTAANGPAALRVCARPAQRVDLMLTDVIMPQMSGKEAALAARRLRADLKVLYMSGYTDDALGRHGVVDADATLLEKPFTRESLARKVREALDHAG